MALKEIKLFCPDCKENGRLWVNPRLCYQATCEVCGGKWEYHKIKAICHKLIRKAESDKSFQHWANCLHIQMQHTINPMTGRTYA